MRRRSILQSGRVLSPLAMFLSVSWFLIVVPWPLSEAAIGDKRPAESQQEETVEERIRRVENGLLPPAVLKGEAPQLMKLEDRMRFHRTPGLSVAVINNGQIEWSRSYGFVEAGGTKRVSVETMFQAASISKPVVAMAALRLVQQGRLKLDEDVNQKLKPWKVPENEFTKDQKVTLRRLLSHSAGITVPGFLGYTTAAERPGLLQILDGQKPANSAPLRVDLVPGSKFRYAGGGYIVLQQLMTEVSGSSFAQFMDKTVLRKLEMTRSSFEQPLSPQAATTAASGHLPDGKVIPGKWYIYPELAPAGLWTTPTDLARFVVEIQKSRQGKSNKVLSKKMIEQMLTPQVENSSLGLFVDGEGNSARFTFSGSNVGFKCYMVGYLNSGQGAVVMANSESGGPLVLEVIRSIAAAYAWPDYRPRERVIAQVDPSTYDAFVGEYEIAPGLILVITKEGDRLMSAAPGQPKSELFPEAANSFFLKHADAQFTFVRDEAGKVVQVNIRRSTREFKAKKIK